MTWRQKIATYLCRALVPSLRPASLTAHPLTTSLETYVLHNTPDLLINLTATPLDSPIPCLTIDVDGLYDGQSWFWRAMDPTAYPRISITETRSSTPYLTAQPVMQWSRWGRSNYLYTRIIEAVPIALQRWLTNSPEPLRPPPPACQIRPLAILGKEILRFCQQLGQRIGQKMHLLPREVFQVYFRPLPPHAPSIIEDPSQWHMFTPLPQPAGHYYADPFLCLTSDTPSILVEDCTLATGKGLLRRVALNGSIDEEILKEPFHLSYPQVFTHEETLYMIPESGDARQIILYEAKDKHSPTHWHRRTTLVEDIMAVDATLKHHDNTWWLFATVGPTAAHKCDSLHLFYADTLTGPYHAHPMNPIVIDATHARPAGPLFTHGTHLIRPSQDSLRGYGTAITFNKIDLLTRTQYAESLWRRLEPPPGKTGIHHYHRLGEYEVVDIKVTKTGHRL